MVTRFSTPRWSSENLETFRDSVRKIIRSEFEPHFDRWIEQGCVDRDAWRVAGETGLLCPSFPEEYGGLGGTLAHDAVIIEELEYSGIGISFSLGLHNAIVCPYYLHYGTKEQKDRWLKGMTSGEIVSAIAMTEPGTGSDLQSVRTTAEEDGHSYRINGQKVFITNGQLSDLVLVVCKTDPSAGAKGISLIAVEGDCPGFVRGRNLKKMGLKASDTSELFFDDAVVPRSNLLGGVAGQGFFQLMSSLPQERLVISIGGAAAMERAVELTTEYAKQRTAFGKPLIEFQNTAFKLAECKTDATVCRTFVDQCVGEHMDGGLSAERASMAKYWVSERQNLVIDACLQVFGGYGYMDEYPISRMYSDARVQRIYGGANEIMKLLIARTL